MPFGNQTGNNVTSCKTTLEELPDKWNNVFAAFILTISILAVAENGFIMMLFCKYKKLRKPSHKIVASVVIADWLTGIAVGPLYSAQLLDKKLNRNCLVHKLRRALAVVIIGASLMSIVFMTIDRSRRLFKIFHGKPNYFMEKKKLYIGIFFCWLLPMLAAAIGLINETVHSNIVSGVGIFLIIVIFASYVIVISALKQTRRKTMDKNKAIYMENERKAGRTMLIIITCYILMLFPNFIEKGLYGTKVLREDTPRRSEAHMVVILFFLANSIVNPIIYASRMREVRKCTLEFLGINSPKVHSTQLRLQNKKNLNKSMESLF